MDDERNDGGGGRGEYETPPDLGIDPSGEAIAIANLGLVLHAAAGNCVPVARRVDETRGAERAALLAAVALEFRAIGDLGHETARDFEDESRRLDGGLSLRPRQPARRAGSLEAPARDTGPLERFGRWLDQHLLRRKD
jgi:hypothetical protein